MTAAAPALKRDIASPEAALELTIVMPCLNEAETIEVCVRKARAALETHNILGEVVVADNGSSDGSQELATRAGARVVPVQRKGYGAALIGGIEAARGRYIVMADADDSYDFSHADRFVARLRDGADLVMGNRFLGGIQKKAMPPLHRYLGNPVLSFLGRLFFKSQCGDFHCGMRGFSKQAFDKMRLRSMGMEFASEMVVKASLFGLRVEEVPTTLSPDGRSRPPHLRTWRDGWRHLRFLLLYSPRWLFLYPGLAFMLVGALVSAWLIPGMRTVGHVHLDVHTLLYSLSAVLLGFQAVSFAAFTKTYAVHEGFLPPDEKFASFMRHFTLERGLILGGLLVAAGFALSLFAVWHWRSVNFGALDVSSTLRIVAPAACAFTLGFQIVLSSCFLGVLGIKHR